MAAQTAAIEPADSTEATLSLLRELRRARSRKQIVNLAFWLYLAAIAIFSYGGWLVAAIVRALRQPPPAVADTPMLLRATPAGLAALALLVLVFVLWDARWRGPVVIAQPTADWLLDTPIRRDRLLRPRYRASALRFMLAGAAAGLVPVALLLAAGLGGSGFGDSLRLAGVAMLSTALLAGLGAGAAAWAEARAYAGLRVVPGVGVLAVTALAGLAALSAAFRLPAAISTILLWSGPWGWAAQGPVALAGGSARLWPAATLLLAAAAAAAMTLGDRAAADVPAAVLRARARTLGHVSAAVFNLDARRVTTAYRGAVGAYARARLRIRPPLARQLVLPWRDLTALIRAPSRLAWSALLALASVGLGALAVRASHAALLPLIAALTLGYLAAAGLCEGARLDGDDPRRAAQLPFRYDALAWWHAIVPCLALGVLAGGPAAALTIISGHVWLLPLIAATITVLVGGALVNSFRGELEGEMFDGFDTPLGNSSGITIMLWYVTGPLLAIGPMIILWSAAISSARAGRTTPEALVSVALAAWLCSIAARRARRLKTA
ncbi:MAG TPA: hypothetical protein VMA32_13450 [Streptosporangiaceae bacterium]|nr:hypothetical protein [Streptosporangiaceae bacterium]